jgi:hypothetical protein
MKKKRNYDITHRVVRVIASDYAFLVGISQRFGVSMSEALHLAITRQIPEIRVSPQRATFRVVPKISIAVNGAGAEHSALVIKPKGGIIYER